ncbi:hypothetical protein Hanom_Chr06g00573011 [Helianthus anomalus]
MHLPPSPSRAGDNEAKKIAEVGIPEVENPVEGVVETEKVISPEDAGADVGHSKSPEVVVRDLEKGKSAQEIPATTSPSCGSMPENTGRNPGGDQGSFIQADENSPIRPDETLGDYYYRCYSKKQADEVHAPVWKLKKGDTFSNWHVWRDWLQGTFPLGEVKFQEGCPHEQTYHAYLEEAVTYTSTTHRIKKAAEDEARVALLRVRLEADQAKFENDRTTEEWSVAGWKRKAEAEASLLSKERKNWKEICEKDNKEKMSLCNTINNLKDEVERLKKQDAKIEILKQEKAEAEAARDEARSHRERSEQREEQLKAEVASAKKDLELERTEKAETSNRLAETEEKLEDSETARAMGESELEPLKNDMLWLKERGIVSVSLYFFR